MKNILIFGDSHVAQLKMAYEKNKNNYPFQLHFVSGPGPVSKKLSFKGTYLYMLENDQNWPSLNHFANMSSELLNEWYNNTFNRFMNVTGQNPIDLNDFDAVVVYGGHMNSRAWWEDSDCDEIYSSSLMKEVLKLKKANSNHYSWIVGLKAYISSGGNVYSVLSPILSELGLYQEVDSSQNTSILKNMPVNANYRNSEKHYKALINELGSKYLELPDEIFSPGFKGTDKKFKSLNSKDYGHVNIEGGTIILESILNNINVSTPSKTK